MATSIRVRAGSNLPVGFASLQVQPRTSSITQFPPRARTLTRRRCCRRRLGDCGRRGRLVPCGPRKVGSDLQGLRRCVLDLFLRLPRLLQYWVHPSVTGELLPERILIRFALIRMRERRLSMAPSDSAGSGTAISSKVSTSSVLSFRLSAISGGIACNISTRFSGSFDPLRSKHNPLHYVEGLDARPCEKLAKLMTLRSGFPPESPIIELSCIGSVGQHRGGIRRWIVVPYAGRAHALA